MKDKEARKQIDILGNQVEKAFHRAGILGIMDLSGSDLSCRRAIGREVDVLKEQIKLLYNYLGVIEEVHIPLKNKLVKKPSKSNG